jgi:hypothetical protein
MVAIASDLREGRVEAITVAGKPVAAEYLAALKDHAPDSA